MVHPLSFSYFRTCKHIFAFYSLTSESSNDFDQKQKSYIMPILMLITCWLCIPMNLKIGYASASVRSSIGVLADSVADKFPLLVVTITLLVELIDYSWYKCINNL